MTLDLHCVEQNWWGVNARSWDRFAKANRASFLCAYGSIVPKALRTRVRAYIFVTGKGTPDETRIAQAAVAFDRAGASFLDRLIIDPSYDASWPAMIEAICRRSGVERFHYGSRWNLEVPRTSALSAVGGVHAVEESQYFVNVIDLSPYRSGDDFRRACSAHHQRDLKTAEKNLPEIRIEMEQGLRVARLAKPINTLRESTYTAKDLNFSFYRSLAGVLLKVGSLNKHVLGSLLSYQGVPYSAFFGAEFGSSTFYVHGGNRRSSSGFSYLLLFRQIERALLRSEDASFFMGSADRVGDIGPVPGFRKFRFGFAAKPCPGSELAFSFSSRDAGSRQDRDREVVIESGSPASRTEDVQESPAHDP